MKDVAEVFDTHKEQESFARLDNKNVVTLNVVKRSGENLILASDASRKSLRNMRSQYCLQDWKLQLQLINPRTHV